MCRNKHAINGSLLLFAALGAATLLSTLIGGKVFAAQSTSNGVYTDSTTGVRWEYELVTDTDNQVDPQVLTIRYYDKPVDATTVKVPSLADLISGVPGATNDLNTYFLKDADTAAQDTAYGASYPRVTTSTPTTVLDMSATNKIQIMGVKPIIDPDVETELIFGEEMVTTDTFAKHAEAQICTDILYNSRWDYYYCNSWDYRPFDVTSIQGWNDMSYEEQVSYVPTIDDFACQEYNGPLSPGNCYYQRNTFREWTEFIGDAFGGYKLKLTNFSASKFNYLGWYTFRNSTFNEENTTVTIEGNSMLGGGIFAGTNVKNININTNNYGTELFRNCQSIENVSFGDGVAIINEDTFAGTNLTSFDFSNAGVKEIKARAFQDAQLTQINLDGVERIGYRAFMGNDIRELTLPKSINYLDVELFRDNYNMKKLTVAYDTMTSGTLRAMFVVLDNTWHGTNQPSMTIEELTVLAPYSANEQVKATHLSMEDYVYTYRDEEHDYTCRMGHWSDNANYWIYKLANSADSDEIESIHWCKALSEPEKLYAKLDEKKNIIAPNYFSEFYALNKITIGDGIEYIGASAFAAQKAYSGTGSAEWEAINDTINKCERNDTNCIGGSNWSSMRKISKISIPNSVKGIGAMAFGAMYSAGMDISIPRDIEYIGQAAFKNAVSLEIDVDFPNLVFLGDNAFAGTMVRNVHLYDKLEYLGYMVFYGAYNLNDITFDLDLFNPEKLYVGTRFSNDDFLFAQDRWGGYKTITANTYSGEMRASFGDSTSHSIPCERAEAWGLNWDCNGNFNFGHHQVFGKITFTDKVVHEPSMPVTNEAGGDGFFPSGDYAGGMTTSRSDTFLNGIAAAEVDLSAAGWKVIPPIMFNHSQIGKLTLPSGTEVIGAMAFSQALIEEELVLPDTIKVIGDAAFDCGEYVSRTGYTPIIIKKLPTSLEYIGHRAFWGDYNLTADLNAPNLKRIGSASFQKTHVRDVLIPSGVEWLLRGTFDNVPTLRNITIDANLSEIAVVSETRPDTYQYFPQIMTDYTKGMFPAYKIVDERTPGYGYPIIEEPTFDTIYTIFNQTSKPSATDMNEGQIEAGETYGTLTFGPHATTTIGGKLGTFAGLSFEKVDMGQAKFTALNLGGDAFYKSKIGTIILPATLQDINYASFMYAEVTNPITLPASLRVVNESAFQWAKIGGLDIKEGLKTIERTAFLWSEIGGQFAFPTSLETIGNNSFMEAKGFITNMLPDSVKTIGSAAFYQSDMAEELTIPAGVTEIGESAFLTNSVDVHYNKVTIKPENLAAVNHNQLVFQMLLNNKIDELVVESTVLAASAENRVDAPQNEEFTKMTMTKATLTNVPVISRSAFEECRNLVEVDLSQDANLRSIKTEAFYYATKLHIIKFSPALKNETVEIGTRAFTMTAFETMGDSTKEFDLTAARFDASAGSSFMGMPKLRTVDIPRHFSNNTVPGATFFNDQELEEVTVDYHITKIGGQAFSYDTKIKKIFIWGNTVVYDSTMPASYLPPNYYGQGADDDESAATIDLSAVNSDTLTIPGQADIYAYSVSPTEAYAKLRGTDNLTGIYYPLDEVLYLTSNKPTVLLSDDESDFDKSDLIVYGLRRDGLVLESDEWAQYDGVVYPRSARPLTFEKMADTVAADPAFGTVYDTPVPLNELNIGNENFAAIDFAIVPAQDDPNVRIVNIVYTDGYTGGEPDTDIDPRTVTPDPTPDPTPTPDPEPEPQPEPEPEVEPEPETPAEPEKPETPVTNDELGKYIAIFAGSFAAGFGLLGYMFFTRRKQR